MRRIVITTAVLVLLIGGQAAPADAAVTDGGALSASGYSWDCWPGTTACYQNPDGSATTPTRLTSSQITSNRDCGHETALADGRRFWVFCDTSFYRTDIRGPKPIADVSSSMALEDSGGTRRTPLFGGQSPPFLDPTNPGIFNATCSTRPFATPRKAVFPMSIAALPHTETPIDATRDELVIFYQQVCDWGGLDYELHDVGVAVFHYTSSDPRLTVPPKATAAGTQPVQASPLNANLFAKGANPDYTFEFGAVVHDNYLYLYRCQNQGACSVANAYAAAGTSYLATATNWWYLDATGGWQNNPNNAPPGLVSQGFWARTADTSSQVLGVPSIVKYTTGYPTTTFVMAYLAPPVFTNALIIRTSPSPTGPWSAPRRLALPRCSTGCVGPVLHPKWTKTTTTPATIGLTYWNLNDTTITFADNSTATISRLRRANLPAT